MKERIESLRDDVLDLQKRSIQYNILKREVDTNQSLYDGLLQRYKEVDIAGGVGANNVFVVDTATLPGGPSSPNMSRALLDVVWCSALGLGIGCWLSCSSVSMTRCARPKRSNGRSDSQRSASFQRSSWPARSKRNWPTRARIWRKRIARYAPLCSFRRKAGCRRRSW